MPSLLDVHGRPVAVTDVVDIPERLAPVEFWSRIPPAAFDPDVAASSLWLHPLLRRHFFAVDVSTPARVHAFHSRLPVVPETLGVRPDGTDPNVVIAGDVPHRPIATMHPLATGTYSPAYYPRRTGDWLENDYLPAYAMSKDPRIGDRLAELLDFMLFSQYRDDGSNDFVATCFPQDLAHVMPEWAGGWDYLFDWEWLDVYGYRWRLHEPDHHVNSQMAAVMVRAYELTGTSVYLASAKSFVDRQVPRYGFHSGVWRDRTYYWTEYNPSGEGNPHRDATDNVQALVAQAVAMVGLRTGDRGMLEYARGLLWHCVREWVTDGRWYYDSAENPINGRRSISHDLAVLLPLLAAVPYLLRGGVRLDIELGVLADAYEFYLAHNEFEAMRRIRTGQLGKLAPERADRRRTTVTSFFTANQAGSELVFADSLPALDGSDLVEVRVSPWTPPRLAGADWGVDRARELVMVRPAEAVARGVPLGISVSAGDVLTLSCTYRDSGRPWSSVAPSEVSFTDRSGARRSVPATTPTAEFPTDVTAATYADAAMRLCCPVQVGAGP